MLALSPLLLSFPVHYKLIPPVSTGVTTFYETIGSKTFYKPARELGLEERKKAPAVVPKRPFIVFPFPSDS
jgi:hypothetical protein